MHRCTIAGCTCQTLQHHAELLSPERLERHLAHATRREAIVAQDRLMSLGRHTDEQRQRYEASASYISPAHEAVKRAIPALEQAVQQDVSRPGAERALRLAVAAAERELWQRQADGVQKTAWRPLQADLRQATEVLNAYARQEAACQVQRPRVEALAEENRRLRLQLARAERRI